MSNESPLIKDDPMYQLLRQGNVEEFNTKRAGGESCDLTGCDFRTLVLRKLDAKGLDLRDCYFRQADLRGIDFTEEFAVVSIRCRRQLFCQRYGLLGVYIA